MTTSPSSTGSKTGVIAMALGVMVLGGCATFSKDGGFGAVEQIARERIDKDVKWQRDDNQRESVQATVKTLLASPLSAAAAVQNALLNNPGLPPASAAACVCAPGEAMAAGGGPRRAGEPHGGSGKHNPPPPDAGAGIPDRDGRAS